MGLERVGVKQRERSVRITVTERENYSIFLGRLAVAEREREREAEIRIRTEVFDVLGLRLTPKYKSLVIGEGRSMEDCSR